MTRSFLPAKDLSGAFYSEAVSPLLRGQPHAAALLGWGSDVLGYDTERSTDHGWGPRLLVFLLDEHGIDELTNLLDDRLPQEFRGWPVRFGWDGVPVRHWVTVTTTRLWSLEHLGVDATAGLTMLDWLLTPQQRLLGVVGGAVYADDDNLLGGLRSALAWYPDELWRWIVACQWRRLAQEEAFVARTAEVGDETGSAVTAARQARDVMRLALLLQRRYAPYHKWLGTAFARLPHADNLPEQLSRVMHAGNAAEREAALAGSYTAVAERHNRAGLATYVDPTTRPYHSRPARVLMADRFVGACLSSISDPLLRSLPLIGTTDQHTDSNDVLEDPQLFRRLATLYQPAES